MLCIETTLNFPLPPVNSKLNYKTAASYTRYPVQYPLGFLRTINSVPYFTPNLQGKNSYSY